MSTSDVREQLYKCTSCSAEDTVKLYQQERTPPCINCWACRAGRKVEVQQMLSQRLGMFPVVKVEDEYKIVQ